MCFTHGQVAGTDRNLRAQCPHRVEQDNAAYVLLGHADDHADIKKKNVSLGSHANETHYSNRPWTIRH